MTPQDAPYRSVRFVVLAWAFAHAISDIFHTATAAHIALLSCQKSEWIGTFSCFLNGDGLVLDAFLFNAFIITFVVASFWHSGVFFAKNSPHSPHGGHHPRLKG